MAVLSFGQRVFEWVVSAVVIVRVFRGVARKRWRFDEKAVLIDGELKIRVASLKPGTSPRGILLRIPRPRAGYFEETGRGPAADATWIFRGERRRAGTILGLEFTVEAVVKPWRYVPLRLTNGGTLSLMADVAMLLRHPIDDESPFSSPSWRDEVPLRRRNTTVSAAGRGDAAELAGRSDAGAAREAGGSRRRI